MKLKIYPKNKGHFKKSIPETFLLSEKSLSKEWLNSDENDAWKDLNNK